ncbi:MAG: hypothetical protein COY38_00040 [Candidatus Aenigmarchaeota archaeon CG_4_10_14_0_8_um_filter_37_24]|nr:hypothetical protein [Candidatus Aenigmarchaeota archaeon]OIN87805.1 MAG: hypothetical protein AUJ50_02500 [Candidatus Aenigmarchaeota archaeon CG1_02_38_14]PIV69376.1 MAG: hypothetical protein COS07_01060 [Candidatus Aenigmarchaeota archaeon CG01_land_8_20_14_3_00_37_9]PIW41776.1 MAG: hypothetical protein COW21_00125 [Candidatus Aenigmarchaeota archaeon CG15_BIG_FIL_POST_REV_8_21_14_020_37_27]PIX50829.1 MAG: hypothetical protein COZ52_02110 [Candidatus Aenigmarchaeota archaeon CG_4_8_14_3_u
MSPSEFLLDENIPKSVKQFIESAGFKVKYMPKGVMNSKAASLARETASVFVSRDSDFLNTSRFPPKQFSGMIIFAIHPPKPEKLVRTLSLFLSEVNEFEGRLFVIGEEGFEIIEG